MWADMVVSVATANSVDVEISSRAAMHKRRALHMTSAMTTI